MSNDILGLDGKPISSDPAEPRKHMAIVGKVYVHYTVFELKPGETVDHAVATYNLMVKREDPNLALITNTNKFYWAEDDTHRPIARHHLMGEMINFMSNLQPDGTLTQPLSEKEIGDQVEKSMLMVIPLKEL